jgi:hypothetical protein
MMTNEETSQMEERIFWKSVLGRFKGYAAGALIGIALGAMTGVAAALVPGVTAALGMSTMGVAGAGALLGAVGLGMVAHSFADIGQTAAAVANGIREQDNRAEAREKALMKLTGLENALPAMNDAAHAHAMHADKEYRADKGPHVHWDAALIGALFGAATGGLFLAGGYVVPGDTAQLALDTAQIAKSPITLGLPGAAGMAACVTGCAFIGSSFGFGGRNFKAVKHYTDGLFEGRLFGGAGKTAERAQAPTAQSQSIPVEPINRLNMLEEAGRASFRQLLAEQAARESTGSLLTR